MFNPQPLCGGSMLLVPLIRFVLCTACPPHPYRPICLTWHNPTTINSVMVSGQDLVPASALWPISNYNINPDVVCTSVSFVHAKLATMVSPHADPLRMYGHANSPTPSSPSLQYSGIFYLPDWRLPLSPSTGETIIRSLPQPYGYRMELNLAAWPSLILISTAIL